jgi:hypothetical protein
MWRRTHRGSDECSGRSYQHGEVRPFDDSLTFDPRLLDFIGC